MANGKIDHYELAAGKSIVAHWKPQFKLYLNAIKTLLFTQRESFKKYVLDTLRLKAL